MPLLGPPRQSFGIVVAIVVAFLVTLFSLLGWTAEWLWMHELGYATVFWRLRGLQIAMFLGMLLIAGLYFTLDLRFLGRIAQRIEASGHAIPTDPSIWAMLRTGGLLVPIIAAILAATFFASSWDDLLRALFARDFGRVDPVFGRDIGFYIFLLPILEKTQNLAAAMTGSVTLVHLMVHHNMGHFRAWPRLDVPTRRTVQTGMAANGAAFVVAWGWGYHLDRFSLLFGSNGAVFGPGYTDVTVVLPALAVMTGASLALVAAIVLGALRDRWTWGALGVGGYVLVAAVSLYLIPAAFQQFVVKPNELELEAPYLERNIAFTRFGFALDRVEEREYPVVTGLTLDEIHANDDTLTNVRLWDWRPLRQTFRQIQEIRLYYEFRDIDVDRYRLDGRLRQVLLSARELSDTLPERADTWVNRTLQYTHGYGLAMALASHEDAAGVPSLIVKDLPPVTRGGLTITQPAIYYGEHMGGHRIVNSGIEEFDHPRGDANVYGHYAGRGGIALSSFWRRLLFAWNRLDLNILISSYVTPESRIQFWREVPDRVRRIAPFLRLDDDPYMVVADGRLFWILDAYTTADSLPYSEPVTRSFNYIRNSVKVVVDAYHGSVDFYSIDPEDPILKAYGAAMPGLFKPLSTMPESIKRHLRYPRDIFAAQVRAYKRYHMAIPQVFYNNEDLWTLAREKYGGKLAPMIPYYILMRLPEEERLQFLLMIPLTPENRENMIGWIAARSDFPGYGQLIVYKFPKDRLLYGPLQVEALIDQDTLISRQISLWDQRGSKVIRGNLLVIPIRHSILYVEPVYLIAEINDVPQLKRVIAAHDGQVAMAPTLEGALVELFGEPPPPGNAPAPPSAGLSPALRAAVRAAESALNTGDWPAFGRAMGKLKVLIEGMGGK